LEGSEEKIEAIVTHPKEQLVFALAVIVEAGNAHSGGVRHVANGRAIVATPGEFRSGAFQNGLKTLFISHAGSECCAVRAIDRK